MSNGACCDLNSMGNILLLHHICPNPKYKCQKQVTFTPREFQMEGSGFEKMAKSFKGLNQLAIKF